MSTGSKRLLVIEDDDLKFREIDRILKSRFGQYSVDRATNVVAAEGMLIPNVYDFLILDISMNISRGQLGAKRGGHANLGGLGIAERMYLYEIVIPTVILTGFDYFRRGGTRRGDNEIVSLAELNQRAKEFLGDAHLGTIRYGNADWEDALMNLMETTL